MLEGGDHADTEALLPAEIAALTRQAAYRLCSFFTDSFDPEVQMRHQRARVHGAEFIGEQCSGLLPAGGVTKFITGQPMAKALDDEAFSFPVEISLTIHAQFLFLSNLLGYRIQGVRSTASVQIP